MTLRVGLVTDLRPPGTVLAVVLIAILVPAGCGFTDSASADWRVVSRNNPTADQSEFWVDVVFEHAGDRYYARCNNYKGGSAKDTVYRCGLHAGDTVNCQWYRDRERSSGYKGYDLICGDKRNQKGELDKFGENELLDIDREEKVRP